MTPARQTGTFHPLQDPVILAALAVNAAVAVLTFFPVLDPNTTYVLVEAWALVPISILAAVAPWVGLPPMESLRERLFWGLWSGSLGVHLVVRIVYLVVPDVDYLVSGSLLVDTLYVLFYLPLILSVLVRPDWHAEESVGREVRTLEFGGTILFTFALLIYFAVIPRVLNQSEYETWVPSFLMYWVFDAYLLLTLFYLRQTTPSRSWRILFSWLAVAPACWVITELMELNFYLGAEEVVWESNAWDVLWYLPWLAITVAGRIRTNPVPGLFVRGQPPPEESELSRALGRPGWLLMAALVLPFMHFGTSLLELMDPSTRGARELVVLVSLALLLGMAFLHQKILEARSLALTRRSRQLEEEQKLLAAAVEQSPDAILIADGEGVVRYGNRAFAALEEGLEGILGATLLWGLPEGLDEAGREGLAAALAGGWPWEGRTVADPARTEKREEMVTVSPVRNREGTVDHWVLIRRDVTYLNQLERQFQQGQQLEGLRSLAGEISEDFNEVMGEMYGYGEFLRQQISDDTSPYKDLRGLLAATERAAGLVGRIMAFSRQGEEAELHGMDSVVREALCLLRPTLPPGIRLMERVEGDSGEVRGARSQLRQVILNLATNAIQAMAEEGGILEVGARRVVVEEEEAAAVGLPLPGPHVLLWIRDTGPGMDDQTLARAFDPFFTTKELGGGTGLGLYLVRSSVSSHGGAIRVSSEVGAGTLFQIFLPLGDLIP